MGSTIKKFIFLVQGEGRGHMTQAISLYDILTRNNHEVSHVFIGRSSRRKIPKYFYRSIFSPITELDSPNFITDPQHKSIRLLPSIIFNIRYLNQYYNSLRQIHTVIQSVNPDVLINFYDFLGSFYIMRYRPKLKYVCIGHQYLTDHPDFIFPKEALLDKLLFQLNNWLTSRRSDRKLALSFSAYYPLSVGKTSVIPPLLRRGLKDLKTSKDDFILCYMVNPGYGQEIMDWHQKNRHVKLHCFWDQKNEPEEKEIHPNLVFHQLNAEKFIDKMSRCKGLVTTAGFESVCEAMYLDKPVLMVPVSGQYEQACNALDASKAGAGIHDSYFNFSRFLQYLPEHKSVSSEFKEWYNTLENTVLKELTDF